MAHFKTAYLQRELVLDVTLAKDLKVGDIVTVADGAMSAVNSLADADYIIAQSDMTMEYGHVPVENRDYKYSDKVAASDSEKKVAVFAITSDEDVILTGKETKA